ncbi:relaxase/mobilization nuclease domain-containing protein, partial [Myroides sp. WP-1]|uniref:relaxase/mobilization nuclease domain-containing protein n=1 Tax=Myroides sp. WP-1 TaxID=2759944 RepID=UPI0015F955DB
MIINATTGQGFTGVLSYVEKEHEKGLTQEQRPEVLQEVNCFGSAKEKAQQMRFVAQENSKASRPVLHLSVSFQENEKLTPQQRDKVLNDVAKEFGATPENNQYVIVKHNDAKHEHYHIVINKVGFDKSNISTQYVQNKCQVVADKLEQKHELQRVQGRKVVYDPSQEKGYRFTTK